MSIARSRVVGPLPCRFGFVDAVIPCSRRVGVGTADVFAGRDGRGEIRDRFTACSQCVSATVRSAVTAARPVERNDTGAKTPLPDRHSVEQDASEGHDQVGLGLVYGSRADGQGPESPSPSLCPRRRQQGFVLPVRISCLLLQWRTSPDSPGSPRGSQTGWLVMCPRQRVVSLRRQRSARGVCVEGYVAGVGQAVKPFDIREAR